MNKALVPVLILAALVLGGVAGSLLARRSPTPSSAPVQALSRVKAPATPAGVLPSEAKGFMLVPDSVDLGEMLEGQARRVHVKLERPAGARIRIAAVKTSCPCLQFLPRKMIVEPGEDAVIEFRLHSLTMSGAETKRFTVELLEPEPLTLTGEVRATVKRVPATLLMEPAEIHLGSVREPTQATARLWNLTKRNVVVGDVHCDAPGVTVALGGPNVIPGGEALELRLQATPKGLAAGPLRGKVLIDTDLPEHARVELPVDGSIAK